MIYSLFLILFGVYIGQEYNYFPSVKVMFTHFVEMFKETSITYPSLGEDLDDFVEGLSDSEGVSEGAQLDEGPPHDEVVQNEVVQNEVVQNEVAKKWFYLM
jgi:hypothetical protein